MTTAARLVALREGTRPELREAILREHGPDRASKHQLPLPVKRAMQASPALVTYTRNPRNADVMFGHARGVLRRHWSEDRRLYAGEMQSADDGTINFCVVVPWPWGGCRCVEATVLWDDNPNALLGASLEAFGVIDQPTARESRLRLLIQHMKRARTAVAYDEAHHMGPNCLNALKTLVNQTPGEFILLALPTLWRRLERGAYEEVKQLLGNRLAERIKLGKLRDSDVKKLLKRRIDHDDARSVAAVLKEAARLGDEGKPHGNLSFVDAVCR